MTNFEKARQLRESVRQIERKLGILEDSEMSCCGISLAQCYSLVEIGRAGTLSLVELAKLLDLDNSTISRTVNNLVDKNLAVRELDPDDRRYVAIQLTPEGLKTYSEIESNMESYFSQIYNLIPVDKKDQVLESLQIMLKAISEAGCCS